MWNVRYVGTYSFVPMCRSPGCLLGRVDSKSDHPGAITKPDESVTNGGGTQYCGRIKGR